MPVEVIGIDHVYVTVRDLLRSEAFYDRALTVLGYRKVTSTIAGDPHVHYYNRQFGFSLRPARSGTADHDPTRRVCITSASAWWTRRRSIAPRRSSAPPVSM